ncbi:plasmid mobilization relaxosome protein MobC [Chitinophaga sp. NPDC101104]|uniref:plasmid mobilization protein n=1 Tax=Chitinophaga sp. NPDC101104 TaxID=3390561 RepID=UPI003D09214B
MGRQKTPEDVALKYGVKTRVDEKTNARLRELLAKSRHRNMAELLRHILMERPIAIYSVDQSVGAVIEELSRLRKQIDKIGININQVVRDYNSTTSRTTRYNLAMDLTELQTEITNHLKQLEPHIQVLTRIWLRE